MKHRQIVVAQKIDYITEQVSRHRKRLAHLLELRLDGEMDKETYAAKKTEAESAIAALQGELGDLRGKEAVMDGSSAPRVVRAVQTLLAGRAKLNTAQQRQILYAIVRRTDVVTERTGGAHGRGTRGRIAKGGQGRWRIKATTFRLPTVTTTRQLHCVQDSVGRIGENQYTCDDRFSDVLSAGGNRMTTRIRRAVAGRWGCCHRPRTDAALVVAIAFAGAARGQPIVYSDGTFNHWSLAMTLQDGPGTAAGQVSADGNPAPSWQVIHTLSTTASQHTIYSVHTNVTATYDPSASGAIARISWAGDVRFVEARFADATGPCSGASITSGDGQGQGLCIVQNGRAYYAGYFYTGTLTTWHRNSANGLTADSFVPVPFQSPEPAHPDFSATGTPITFGVLGANSTGPGGGGYCVTTRIDNWTVSVERSCDSCPADLNCDGLVDFLDYLEFLNFFDAQDPRADFNHDGIIDFSDYLEFLNLYDAGC